MQNMVSLQQCANPRVYIFTTQVQFSRYVFTTFFTQHNLEYSQRDFSKIGVLAEQVVRQILAFYEIRTVFVNSTQLTVVLKNNKQWETLPEQIVRIIEKAIDELGGWSE